MQTSVTFRHMETSTHLRDYADSKLTRLDKYLDSTAEAHVVLSVEKFRHTADVILTADSMKIKGVEETEDMYSAIDLVVDNVEKQVRRQTAKRKSLKKSKAHDNIKSLSFTLNILDSPAVEAEETQFIQTKSIQAKPMDVDEAVEQLDLMKNDFLMFTNAKTETINVVYRRKDGKLGLIEPS